MSVFREFSLILGELQATGIPYALRRSCGVPAHDPH
jgi:hypothetical protein